MPTRFLADQKGISHLILIAVVGLILFLVVASLVPFGDFRLASLFPKPASQAANPWNGVPDLPIDYSQDVLTWWNEHPFNQESPNYRPDITSPANQFNVQTQYGGNIQSAIDAAAAAGGGTLIFPSGNYSGTFALVGKSNIHFIGQGTVIINLSAPAVIAGCQTSVVYADISAKVAAKDPAAVNCVTDGRAKNIYFKNIIFDGGGTLLQSMAVSATKNMIYDNITFRNFRDPGDHHRGLVSGNAVLDNIWFRNSTFAGDERVPLYLDGLHGGGVINSQVTGKFGSGGFLFLTNDDLSRDYDNDGTIEINEQRTANHVVVANNTYNAPIHTGTSATGRDILVIGNTFNYGISHIADFDAKSSHVEKTLVYNYYGNMVINNTTQGLKYLMDISASPDCPMTTNCSKQGKYVVKGNKTSNASGFIKNVNEVSTSFGTIDTPNDVSGNCVNNPSCTPVGPTAVPAPTTTPVPVSTPLPSSSTGSNEFPIGVFEDGNITFGNATTFGTMIDNLKSKGFNAVMFVNNTYGRDAGMLSVSDQKDFNVYISANGNTNPFLSDSTPTIEEARALVYPAVDAYKTHPSVKGYNIIDEPHYPSQQQHTNLLVQAYKERDPARLSSPVFIGLNRGDLIYDSSKPNAFFMDAYPFNLSSAQCDFSMKGFGLSSYSMSSYIRQLTRNKPVDQKLYIILQTHNFGTADGYNLRVPTIPEIRGQHWIAIGEGAHGIFWFVYSSQQGWTGIKDSPTILAETSALAQRINPLKSTLLNTHRHSTDLFAANNGAYVSTLTSKDGLKKYAVVANIGNCSGDQAVTISSSSTTGQLKDLESGQTYSLNQPISFGPGDGKIFELVNEGTATPVPSTPVPSVNTTVPNILTNGSFEGSTGWTMGTNATIDTTVARSGNSSMKATGAMEIYTRQTPTLKPNTLYSYSVWVKTESVTGLGAWLRYVQLSPSTLTLAQTSPKSGTGDWQNFTGSFTTPSTFQNGRFDLYYKLNAGDTIWFDDVVLCEGDVSCLSPATPAPSAAKKPGDGNGDGKVDIHDYNGLVSNFGKRQAGIADDYNNDGVVDIQDYNILLSNFGK